MDRTAFHCYFKSPGPVVLPVIHVLDTQQAVRNARLAIEHGAAGVLLINHDFPVEPFLPIVREVRQALPSLWMGLNFLAVTGRDAFPVLAQLENDGTRIDAYWADDARIDERVDSQTEADEIAAIRDSCGWRGLYFGGTAFKKQRPVAADDYPRSAALACHYMDAVTTSGLATGEAASLDKVSVFRDTCADHPLAIASGITVENAIDYAPLVDAFLVATGISPAGDFYNIDAARLAHLTAACRRYGAQHSYA